MVERLEFKTENVCKIDELLQEGLEEVVKNITDRSYPYDKPREVILRIVVTPDKNDPKQLDVGLFKQVKLPKRFGKPLNGVLLNGRILVEVAPEVVELFGKNVSMMRKEEQK